MTDEHGNCPACNADMNGGSIWETGLAFALAGKHYRQQGVPATGEEAERLADDYAEAYGAHRTKGRWGRAIGIVENDSVARWQCPYCGHEWAR